MRICLCGCAARAVTCTGSEGAGTRAPTAAPTRVRSRPMHLRVSPTLNNSMHARSSPAMWGVQSRVRMDDA